MSDQDAVSLQISLPQMLDLALGTPEVGAVNLNILHHFLHVLLHQINLKETVVEYKGDEAARMKTMVASLKPAPALPSIKPATKEPHQKEEHERAPGDTEQVDIEHMNNRLAQVENDLAYISEDISTLRDAYQSIPKSTDDSPPPKPSSPNPPSAAPEEVSDPSGEPEKPPVRSENGKRASTHRLPLGSSDMNALKNDVSGLKTDITKIKGDYGRVDSRLTELEKIVLNQSGPGGNPGTTAPASSSGESKDPEASKIPTTPVEHQHVEAKKDHPDESHEPSPLHPASPTPEEELLKPERADNAHGSHRPSVAVPISPPAEQKTSGADRRSSEPEQRISGADRRISEADRRSSEPEQRSSGAERRTSEAEQRSSGAEKAPTTHEIHGHAASPGTSSPTAPARQPSPEKPTKVKEGAKPPSISPPNSHRSPTRPAHSPRRSQPKHQIIYAQSDDPDIIRMMEALRNIEIMYGEAIHNLDNRVIHLEREVKSFNEKLRSIPCGPDGVNEIQEMVVKIRREHSKIEEMNQVAENRKSEESEKLKSAETDPGIIQEIQDLVGKIQNIQADIEQINQMAARLAEEKQHRESDTNALLEQIELLKTVKANKEDLEDALADKADATAVKTKVSVDQFDTTRDDLTRGLEDAVAKLTQQETIWQQALEDVQREIEGKLDKIEIGPIKEFVYNRLKVLQDKLKEIAEKRREQEAAGTKKMLSDVQCISCDKNVVMKTEEDANYHADPMPCTRSIKPYLTYELDQVRKQQKRLPSRDMIQFNSALQEMGRRTKLTKEDTSSKGRKDHLCNRYCGGSHTITTPHQRVMRMGHFLAQWGPDAVQLTDGAVEGNDGKLYRGRPMPPGTASRKSEILSTPVQGEKPAVPSPEASKILSPRKSQTSQKRVSSVTQVPKRGSKRISENLKEPIHEEPHPSPRSEPEALPEPEKSPDEPDEVPESKSPEIPKEEEDNGEEEI